MLRAERIYKTYGKLKVLNRVSATFKQGQVCTLIGPNGSGKTTLIKCFLGLVMPDEGEIFFNEQAIDGSWDYRHYIGYMPQITRFPENIRINQLFDMMTDIRGNGALDKKLYHQFGLDKIGGKRLGVLSGGTKQKVSAALAFLFNPQVLILDEPTAGLDPVASEHLKNHIQEMKAENKTILITSHNMSEVEELADRVIFLVEGEMKFNLPVSELKSETSETQVGKALAKKVTEYEHY